MKIPRNFSRFLIFLLLLALGCKKDEPAARVSVFLCLPTVIVTPEFLVQIYYNQDSKIVRFTAEQQPYVYQTEFVYDSKQARIVSANFLRAAGLFSGFASVASQGTYSYDAQGQLTAMDSTVSGTVFHTTYSYNSAGQLVTSSQFVNSTGTDFLLTTTTYEYPNGTTRNPSTIIDTSGAIRTYMYDDKPNPARVLGIPSILPDNNIVQQTYTLGTSTNSYSYGYQYNEYGYPTSKKSETRETQYVYDCKNVFQ